MLTLARPAVRLRSAKAGPKLELDRLYTCSNGSNVNVNPPVDVPSGAVTTSMLVSATIVDADCWLPRTRAASPSASLTESNSVVVCAVCACAADAVRPSRTITTTAGKCGYLVRKKTS